MWSANNDDIDSGNNELWNDNNSTSSYLLEITYGAVQDYR